MIERIFLFFFYGPTLYENFIGIIDFLNSTYILTFDVFLHLNDFTTFLPTSTFPKSIVSVIVTLTMDSYISVLSVSSFP